MKKTAKQAFINTLPVLAGYMVLGFGFGIIMHANGYSILLTFTMSLLIYAGAMQYVAIGLFAGGASFFTTAITTVMVNARHLFYSVSMLDKYKDMGLCKPYLIFALTDETYSLVCNAETTFSTSDQKRYYLFVSLFDHIYWVTGSVLGAIAGNLLSFNSTGIDFALAALFITVYIEQLLTSSKHTPAIIGVAISAICLLVFGKESFLIPAMLFIALALCMCKEDATNE